MSLRFEKKFSRSRSLENCGERVQSQHHVEIFKIDVNIGVRLKIVVAKSFKIGKREKRVSERKRERENGRREKITCIPYCGVVIRED